MPQSYFFFIETTSQHVSFISNFVTFPLFLSHLAHVNLSSLINIDATSGMFHFLTLKVVVTMGVVW